MLRKKCVPTFAVIPTHLIDIAQIINAIVKLHITVLHLSTLREWRIEWLQIHNYRDRSLTPLAFHEVSNIYMIIINQCYKYISHGNHIKTDISFTILSLQPLQLIKNRYMYMYDFNTSCQTGNCNGQLAFLFSYSGII